MSNGEIEAAPAGSIVVGVDGSGPSIDALKWAAHQAELTGAPLVAVTAWRFPTTYGMAVIPEGIDFGADARAELDDTLQKAFEGKPPVPITATVAEGSAAYVVMAIAADASLIVVGSRGRGSFSGMLLGSVSAHIVSNANCPVVVVRHPHHAQ